MSRRRLQQLKVGDKVEVYEDGEWSERDFLFIVPSQYVVDNLTWSVIVSSCTPNDWEMFMLENVRIPKEDSNG